MSEPPSGPPGACPRCGAPYTPGQEYCLECGLRLPVRRGMLASLNRRRWYPGDWILPVLLFLVLAGLGTIAAILVTRDDSEPALIATTPAATGGTGQSTLPEPPTSVAPTTEPPPTTQPAPTTQPPPSRPIKWPDRNGYTVVLQSIPTSSSRAEAVRTARRALRNGLTDVGVLASSNYPSLQPGYYVVFAGVYGSPAAAASHLGEAQNAGFQVPYVRPVTR